jgi:hypothetical protein
MRSPARNSQYANSALTCAKNLELAIDCGLCLESGGELLATPAEWPKQARLSFTKPQGRCEQRPSRPSSGSTTGSPRGRRIDYFDARFKS